MKKIIFAVLISLVLVISMAGIAAADGGEMSITPEEDGSTALAYGTDSTYTWEVPGTITVNDAVTETKVTINFPAVFPQDVTVTVSGAVRNATDTETYTAASSLVLFHKKQDESLDPDTTLTATLKETVGSKTDSPVTIENGVFKLTGVKHTTAEIEASNISLKAILTGAVKKAGNYSGKITFSVDTDEE